MTPDDKPQFDIQDLWKIIIVNLKVILALIFFLLVFFSLFFGYYSFFVFALAIAFLIYALLDKLRKNTDDVDTER
jgi:hypothetical protein